MCSNFILTNICANLGMNIYIKLSLPFPCSPSPFDTKHLVCTCKTHFSSNRSPMFCPRMLQGSAPIEISISFRIPINKICTLERDTMLISGCSSHVSQHALNFLEVCIYFSLILFQPPFELQFLHGPGQVAIKHHNHSSYDTLPICLG